MDNILNKPRVFLSRSSKDKDFINKLDGDLRKCHIETWMDTYEMRDGKSWLKMIFESGIPTCNAVIVYLTENSISSPIVEKEMDAALIENMSDKGIVFLPYVNKAGLRKKLRVDIQTLHCREWNEDNYNEVLPTVVAEIWHSYMEKTVVGATTQEKNRRLELEIELKKLQDSNQGSPFSSSEDADFKHIYNALNRPMEIKQKSDGGTDIFKFFIVDLLFCYVNEDHHEYYNNQLSSIIDSILEASFPGKYFYNDREFQDITVELRTYGLVRTTSINRDIDHSKPYFSFSHTQNEFTEKLYRFKYWMGYNKLTANEPRIEYVGNVPATPASP